MRELCPTVKIVTVTAKLTGAVEAEVEAVWVVVDPVVVVPVVVVPVGKRPVKPRRRIMQLR